MRCLLLKLCLSQSPSALLPMLALPFPWLKCDGNPMSKPCLALRIKIYTKTYTEQCFSIRKCPLPATMVVQASGISAELRRKLSIALEGVVEVKRRLPIQVSFTTICASRDPEARRVRYHGVSWQCLTLQLPCPSATQTVQTLRECL